MKTLPKIVSLTGMDIKRLRIDAGFDSVPEAASIMGIDSAAWYKFEAGQKKVGFHGNANTLWWALLGYKAYMRSQQSEQALSLPDVALISDDKVA